MLFVEIYLHFYVCVCEPLARQLARCSNTASPRNWWLFTPQVGCALCTLPMRYENKSVIALLQEYNIYSNFVHALLHLAPVPCTVRSRVIIIINIPLQQYIIWCAIYCSIACNNMHKKFIGSYIKYTTLECKYNLRIRFQCNNIIIMRASRSIVFFDLDLFPRIYTVTQYKYFDWYLVYTF